MIYRGCLHTIITAIVITTYEDEGIQAGPIPKAGPRRQEEGEKGEKDREERCFTSTF